MIQYERRRNILEYLKTEETATVKELAEKVYASEASVRRDVEALEQDGLVRRIWGGVTYMGAQNGVVPINVRDTDNAANKNMIAKRAAELIPDGATVFLDASSTVRRIIKHLGNKRDLTVITNNQRIFEEAENLDAKLYSTGGFYNRKNHAFTGPLAEEYVRGVYADIFFFSSQGISEDGEITDASEEETSLRRAMLERSKQKYFLCDSSKIGIKKLFTVCQKSELDGIICDTKLPWEKE